MATEAASVRVSIERTSVQVPSWRLVVPGVVILLLGVSAVIGPLLTPYDPIVGEAVNRLKGPSMAHPFGTDQLGRDVLTRALYGLRTTLLVALASGVVATVVATGIGLTVGYFGGIVDFLTQRLLEMFAAVPTLVLVAVVVSVAGTGAIPLVLTIGMSLAPIGIRLIRTNVLRLREAQFCEAARAIGATHYRVLVVHILPNVLGSIAVLASLNVGVAVFVETGLSFLGLGVQPPTPSLGNMLTGASQLYFMQAPWMVVFPGIIVTMLILGFNLLGDWLADYFDPRVRARVAGRG